MDRKKLEKIPYSFPSSLLDFIGAADVYDSSCSDEAKVYYLDKEDGYYLKVSPEGSLRKEAELTSYFHGLGLSAEVLDYFTFDGDDYFLTKRIPGEDCIFKAYHDDPKRLSEKTAELLRMLHQVDGSGCPGQDRLSSYIESVNRGMGGDFYEPDLFKGLWEFEGFDEAKKAAIEGTKYLKGDALIHGDYCLPNIILDDWEFSGFIDLGNGGIADRHIDILWGIKTLRFNFKTSEYTDRFIDAYGRKLVEPEKLRLIAAMEMVADNL